VGDYSDYIVGDYWGLKAVISGKDQSQSSYIAPPRGEFVF